MIRDQPEPYKPMADPPEPPFTPGTVLTDELRLLTFRRPSAAIALHWRAYLAFGLLFVWLAGMGRYWDNPRAALWQSLLAAYGWLAWRARRSAAPSPPALPPPSQGEAGRE